jgi:hypothetical protein
LSFVCHPKTYTLKVNRTITSPAVLYAGETWSFILQEKQMLKVFETRVIRTTLVNCWSLQNQKHRQVLLKVKVKVKFTLEQATKAQNGSGWSMPRPGCFTPGKENRHPLSRRLGEPQEWSGRMRKISPHWDSISRPSSL